MIRYSVTMICDILMAWAIWVSFSGWDMQDVTIREDNITIAIFSKNLDSSEWDTKLSSIFIGNKLSRCRQHWKSKLRRHQGFQDLLEFLKPIVFERLITKLSGRFPQRSCIIKIPCSWKCVSWWCSIKSIIALDPPRLQDAQSQHIPAQSNFLDASPRSMCPWFC